MKMETDPSKPSPVTGAIAPPRAGSPEGPTWRKFQGMILFTAILLVIFGRPLFRLAVYALHSELYSHILLIPFVCAYLIRLNKEKLALDSRPDRRWAWLPLAAGAIALAG